MDSLIRHIITWEVLLPKAVARRRDSMIAAYASPEDLFNLVRPYGYSLVKGDAGGPTMIGVTLSTYRQYCSSNGLPVPDVDALKAIPFMQWRDIIASLFWVPSGADAIRNGSIALMIVDWRWVNGSQAIRDLQSAFSLVPDGIVGPKTLAALNAAPAEETFLRIKAARQRSYRAIVRRKPSQARFLNGWLNRTDAIPFIP